MGVPYAFLWEDGTEEDVFSFSLDQSENSFATLDLEIRNPRVGLLSPSRPLWGTLSYNGTALFYGRLVGIPDGIEGETVSLSFIARPENHDEAKRALAQTLKQEPYWDAVWISEDRISDPDVVLEARPAYWHTDRVTHALTISSIVQGEAGIRVLDADEVFYDSVAVSLNEPPVSTISCTATVSWEQQAKGTCNVSAAIGNITTLTGQGLTEDWPKRGDNIGSGWEVSRARWQRLDGGGAWWGIALEGGGTVGFPVWTIKPTLVAKYDVSRQRSETLSFTLHADVQAVTSEAREEDRLTLQLSSDRVGVFVDDVAAPDVPSYNPIYIHHAKSVVAGVEVEQPKTTPLFSLASPRYFQTDRGRASVRYLIALARSRLIARARAVSVSFETPFDVGIGITLRHSAQVVDPRLPGGQATGKITAYSLSLDGDSGQAVAAFTMACMVGKGNSLAPAVGVGSYVEAGYVASGYQVETGGQIAIEGDVAFNDFSALPIDDDGLRFDALSDPDYALLNVAIVNGAEDQQISGPVADFSAAASLVNAQYTEVALTFRPLEGGPFETALPITVTALMIPKTVDLEAASAGGA